MTIRQKFLKLVYPFFMWWTKRSLKGRGILTDKHQEAPVSFYSLKSELINGSEFDFSQLKGKKILLVNTASDCGYTGQYAQLEQLQKKYSEKLLVIGFPANDFKEQEKGTNEEIAGFCRTNFGVSFPLMKKTTVVKGPQQDAVYKWLTDPEQNGWNKRQPAWNFSKYLVNEQGKLISYFAPAISPLDESVINAIVNH